MPTLSIIVPYRGNDSRLEATLVSILENRPEDCEILVVHDGSYSDPYQLADEVLFIESEPGISIPEMLHAGVLASCSPVVNTVLDGVTVLAGWTTSPLEEMRVDADCAAVAMPLELNKTVYFGVSSESLTDPSAYRRNELLCTAPDRVIRGPLLSCGFFRRSILMILDGFVPGSSSYAELDFALSMDALSLPVACTSDVLAKQNVEMPAASDSELASLAIEGGALAHSGMALLKEFMAMLTTRPSKALIWPRALQLARPGKHAQRMVRARDELRRRAQQSQLTERQFAYRRAA